MIGSNLLGQQPTFGGADFGIPEIALFGYYQFRKAVPTSDTWEEHGGIEILFMQSGEACWDLPDDHFSMATGSQAVIFPAGRRHRISNGVYTPCRLLWLVFQPKDVACGSARLFLGSEIEALFELANSQERPVDLPEGPRRVLGELCSRLTDERLMIGSTPLMAEVRSKVYSSVTSLWEICANDHTSGVQSRLVRQAAALLREGTEDDFCRQGREHRGGRPSARLRQEPALQPLHQRSRHGAERLSPARPHQALLRAADQDRRLDHLHRHRQRLSLVPVLFAGLQEVRRRDPDRVPPTLWTQLASQTRARAPCALDRDDHHRRYRRRHPRTT